MIYPIEIKNPFANRYGGIVKFSLPQEVNCIKSLSINILNIQELIDNTSGLPVELKFDLFNLSIILNNGYDETIVDAPTQLSIFQNNSDWRGGLSWYKNTLYEKQKVILNKGIIRNSVHYAVFKMTDDLLDYIKLSMYTQEFGDYLRSEDFKLTLYVETK